MKAAIVEIEGASPLSFSKYYEVPKKEGEKNADYEERTWKERMHYNEEGYVIIPPMALKNCLTNAAKYLSERIEGEGKKTWTKKFEAGLMVVDPIVLSIKKEDVQGERLLVPADGTRGGTTRVPRIFPKIESWSGKAKFFIIDESIATTQGGKVFERHLDVAGKFIGLLRFRPSQNGYYGRFNVKSIEYIEE